MQQYRHLFVIDPLPALNLRLDTSLRLAWHLNRLGGHEILSCTIADLHWQSGGPAAAVMRPLTFGASPEEPKLAERPVTLRLDELHCIHMRKDPPFNTRYLSATWMLDSVAGTTLVVNRPRALQSLNEKMATLLFPAACIPSMVSSDATVLAGYFAGLGTDAVIKPLDLFGGRGIERLKASDYAERESLLRKLSEATRDGEEARMLQPYRQEVEAGEVRAFYAFGRPVAWCLKKPKPGNFLANTAAGATLHGFRPSAALEARTTDVSRELMRQGVFLVGYDIIGEEISEINITSPRLLYHDEASRDAAFTLLAAAFSDRLGSSDH